MYLCLNNEFGIRKQLKILRVSILCYNSLKIMIFNISGPFVKMTGQSLLFIGFMIDLASFSLLDGFQIRLGNSKFATSCHPKGIINMKKTLTLLIAMGSFAVSSEAATVFNYYTPGTDNYNSTIHGFYLSLGSSSLAPSDSSSPSSLSGEIRLDSFTLRGAANNLGANVTYGFLVLNGSDNSVIGWSTNTGTTAAGINLTFSFSSLDGSPLLLDAALTYRFLAVSQSVMGLMQDTSKTYLYAAGGTAAPTANTEGDTVTISGGLTAPGIRGHYDAEGTPGDSVVITGANGTNTFSLLSPIFTEIRGEMVPEPATVSLGLLGLAALMMRRRRA
ncbi:hypothetical protein CUC06_05455 [Akkermansia muciniphila]|nr:hypothetical protein CUC06_05455 [Akkermansia muciniphila]